MRVVAGIAGAALIALMLSEFFVTFLLPRRVRRDPRIARGLLKALWRPWRALARRLAPSSADTLLGFFGPLALLFELLVWTLGLVVGYGLVDWAAAGGSFRDRLLFSSGLFLSAEGASGTLATHVLALLEAATGVGVLFIVIGYMPAVYGSFSRREIAVSQLATRAGSPPAAGVLLRRAAGRENWRELERDLRGWEEWAAELMETHLSYPLLGFYRSQHVGQNWLAALTAMVDVAAFVKAVQADGEVEAAELTFKLGRHALSDLALQYGLERRPVERLSGPEFDELYGIVEDAISQPFPRDEAWHRLAKLRAEYEPQAQALADFLVLELPPWLADKRAAKPLVRKRGVGVGTGRGDLVG
jgi:hypothetical protein